MRDLWFKVRWFAAGYAGGALVLWVLLPVTFGGPLAWW